MLRLATAENFNSVHVKTYQQTELALTLISPPEEKLLFRFTTTDQLQPKEALLYRVTTSSQIQKAGYSLQVTMQKIYYC